MHCGKFPIPHRTVAEKGVITIHASIQLSSVLFIYTAPTHNTCCLKAEKKVSLEFLVEDEIGMCRKRRAPRENMQTEHQKGNLKESLLRGSSAD